MAEAVGASGKEEEARELAFCQARRGTKGAGGPRPLKGRHRVPPSPTATAQGCDLVQVPRPLWGFAPLPHPTPSQAS